MDGSVGDKEDQTDPEVRHARNGPRHSKVTFGPATVEDVKRREEKEQERKRNLVKEARKRREEEDTARKRSKEGDMRKKKNEEEAQKRRQEVNIAQKRKNKEEVTTKQEEKHKEEQKQQDSVRRVRLDINQHFIDFASNLGSGSFADVKHGKY